MPYCTQQDLIDRYGEEELLQLADRDRDDTVDTTVIDQAIADADAEIDGYLATRYPLPLADVPPALVRVACEIVRYHLYAHAPTETVKDRYANAVKFLREVANGHVSLVRETGATAETAGVAEFETGRSVMPGGGF